MPRALLAKKKKPTIRSRNSYRFSSYRAVNTPFINYKRQTVNTVSENNAVYRDNPTKHINTECEQNAEFLNVRTGGQWS